MKIGQEELAAGRHFATIRKVPVADILGLFVQHYEFTIQFLLVWMSCTRCSQPSSVYFKKNLYRLLSEVTSVKVQTFLDLGSFSQDDQNKGEFLKKSVDVE